MPEPRTCPTPNCWCHGDLAAHTRPVRNWSALDQIRDRARAADSEIRYEVDDGWNPADDRALSDRAADRYASDLAGRS